VAATPDAQEFEAADSDTSSVTAMKIESKSDTKSPSNTAMDIEEANDDEIM
jgi:hypothetical protein